MAIDQTITDFVSYDVVNDYYDEEQKNELVKMFEEIINEDEVTVRKFLERFFDSSKDIAKEFGFFEKSGDTEDQDDTEMETEPEEETPVDDEENQEEIEDESTEEEQEEMKNESHKVLADIAAYYLYE